MSCPFAEEYTKFGQELVAHADIDESMKNHFAGFPRSAPPMAILSAMINALSCFHPEFHELDDPSQFEKAAAQLISKVRTLAAFAYRRSNGLPYIYPDRRLPYVVNFLHMMFSNTYEQHRPQSLSQCRLLQRHHPQSRRKSGRYVHCSVRHGSITRVDRPLERAKRASG